MDVQTMSGMGMGAMMGGGLGGLLRRRRRQLYAGAAPDLCHAVAESSRKKATISSCPPAKMGKSVPLLGDAPGETKPTATMNPIRRWKSPKAAS
jgi:hypothetical protein